MEIKIIKVNTKKIINELEKFIDEEFKNYKVFSSLAKKFNRESVVNITSVRNTMIVLNSYDLAFRDKNKLTTTPLTSSIYATSPYNNKFIFDSVFDFNKIDDENIEVVLRIEPIEKINEHLLVFIKTQMKLFNEFINLDSTNFEETIISALKLNFSNAFEIVSDITKMNKEDEERLEIKNDLDFYLKEIAYALVDIRMPEVYEEVLNENSKK